MGLLVNGQWQNTWYDTKNTEGKFVRESSQFHQCIGSQSFPAEKDRYHLFVSYACPWAHRTLIFLVLKELQSIIGVTVVDPDMLENGWEFSAISTDNPINEVHYLHQVYTLTDPAYTGRVTVPVLWDKKQKTIVCNESSEIIRQLNTAFNDITGNNTDFYPAHHADEIDQVNTRIYNDINNGVYRVGFATQQDAYEAAYDELFSTLDWLEQRLSNQRYLVGNQITEADWRLFTTLVRFDPVYYSHFKANKRRLIDYHNIWNYVCELYQVPGIAATVNLQHIKRHYFFSHSNINPTQIVPKGPEIDYMQKHDRGKLSKND